jgi:dipeptidyl aminopeptidase/acylaminoacyl peptidase
MAKKVHDDVLDGAWNIIKNNCNKITVCEGEPASFAEANTAKGSGGKALADTTATGTDFTLANGDASGRKVTVAAKDGVAVDDTGNADHIALLDTSNSRLLYVTTCTTKGLTSGDSVNIPAWDAEIADPT